MLCVIFDTSQVDRILFFLITAEGPFDSVLEFLKHFFPIIFSNSQIGILSDDSRNIFLKLGVQENRSTKLALC